MTAPRASFWHSGLPRDCLTPIAVTDPAAASYPGLSSGTGFFVRRDRDVYLITALHCLESVDPPITALDMARRLTIPYRMNGSTSRPEHFVQFTHAKRLAEDQSRSSFVDAVALKVRTTDGPEHEELLARAAILPPTGLWLEGFVDTSLVRRAIAQREALTFLVIGYPNHGTSTGIEYPDSPGESLQINLQPAQFAADLRLSTLDHCFRLDNLTWPGDLAGFSGSPVFVLFRTGDTMSAALAGMIICGGQRTLHFLSVSTLVRAATA